MNEWGYNNSGQVQNPIIQMARSMQLSSGQIYTNQSYVSTNPYMPFDGERLYNRYDGTYPEEKIISLRDDLKVKELMELIGEVDLDTAVEKLKKQKSKAKEALVRKVNKSGRDLII